MAIGFRPSVDALGGISNMSPSLPVDQPAPETPYANVPLAKEPKSSFGFQGGIGWYASPTS